MGSECALTVNRQMIFHMYGRVMPSFMLQVEFWTPEYDIPVLCQALWASSGGTALACLSH